VTITVNIHEAKTHLSRLVEQAAKGRDFVIAKAGKPMVRVLPLEAAPTVRALGFLAGHGVVEVDVKEAFATDIDSMFGAVTR
jgi:prevent-host-death family protein